MCEKNGDGWGMMWIENNQIRTEKAVKPFVDLWNAYQKRIAFNPIIHLRWKTHGEINDHNAHPYYCGHGIFMMHNGVVNSPSDIDKKMSDTWNFIETWLKPLLAQVRNPHHFIRSEAFRTTLEHEIGWNNRIVMGDRGGFVTFNEKQWHKIENEYTEVVGLVVSNTYAWGATSYGKPVPVATVTNISNQGSTKNGKRFNAFGALMSCVLGNIYMDPQKGVWLDSHGSFIRAPKLDSKIDEIKTAYQNAKNKQDKKKLRKSWKQEAEDLDARIDAIFDNKKPPLPVNGVLVVNSVSQIAMLQGFKQGPDGIWTRQLPEPVVNTTVTASQQQPLILLPAPAKPTDEELDARDEAFQRQTSISKEEYTEMLTRNWAKESSSMINSLVYTEPDDAAKVLWYLLNCHYIPDHQNVE